ncbi:MAG: metallophosphoesterase, partial [Deltaproteobacteria bacterium]|nr:metallophosphoesterase [Deltaproteobacteria bacterium]
MAKPCRVKVLVLILTALMLAFVPWHQTAAADGDFHLTVLHVNDPHAHLWETEDRLLIDQTPIWLPSGGFGRLAAKIKQIRAKSKNTLLLHAGDVFQGTLYFTKYHGLADLDLMNRMGFDAMAVGNHEFDLGPATLAQFASQARFPVLSANIDVSGEPLLSGLIKPMVIKEVGGRKIGIIGATTPATTHMSSPGPKVKFESVAPVIGQWVQKLSYQGVNIIIVLSHLGLDADIKLAHMVPGIDVILGGHSHTLLGDFGSLGLPTAGP